MTATMTLLGTKSNTTIYGSTRGSTTVTAGGSTIVALALSYDLGTACFIDFANTGANTLQWQVWKVRNPGASERMVRADPSPEQVAPDDWNTLASGASWDFAMKDVRCDEVRLLVKSTSGTTIEHRAIVERGEV